MASGHKRPRVRRRRHELGSCQDCGVALTADNWSWFGKAYRRYTCKPCWVIRQAAYLMNDKPETVEAKCNLLLGHADDDTRRLRAAIAYLIDPPAC